MIDQKFLDIATPLIRARLAKLGMKMPEVPVILVRGNNFNLHGTGEYVPTAALGLTTYWQAGDLRAGTPRDVQVTDAPKDPKDDFGLLSVAGLGPYSEHVWAAAVLTHELIHTAMPSGVGHEFPFNIGHRVVGMIGPATSSIPGPKMAKWVEEVLEPALRAPTENKFFPPLAMAA